MPSLPGPSARSSEILFPKTPLGDGVFIAEIRDSEGNRIALQSACGERP